MISRIWKELLILLLVFGLIWAVFTYFTWDWDSDITSLSIEKEEELSDYLIDHIFDRYDAVADDYVDSALLIITDRLLESLDSSDYDYKIWVLETSEVNAFATLGGNIFLFSGLFDFVESPEELSAVLAHEIGHVEHRHVIDKLTQQLGLEVLFSILTGGDPILLSEVSKLLVSTSFDRRKEREADEFAMELAKNANINPRRLAQFFLKVSKKQGEITENLEIIMTHPHSNSRIKAASDYELDDDFEEIPFDIDWDKLKRQLKERS